MKQYILFQKWRREWLLILRLLMTFVKKIVNVVRFCCFHCENIREGAYGRWKENDLKTNFDPGGPEDVNLYNLWYTVGNLASTL